MPRLPICAKQLLVLFALLGLTLLGTFGYYNLFVFLESRSSNKFRNDCNFSTSSSDVCATALETNRVYEQRWTGGYSVISPAHSYYNEALLNPALSTNAAQEPKAPCPSARRYVLDLVEPDHLYYIRLCYRGSPAVNYRIRFFHIRRSSLHGVHAAGYEDATAVSRVAEPLDTVVLPVRMQCRTGLRASLFHSQEETWCDRLDLSPRTLRAVPGSLSDEQIKQNGIDPFLPVLEITPEVLAVTNQPERFPCLHYDLHIDKALLNVVPPHIVTGMLPVVLFALSIIFVGPWLMRRMQDAEDEGDKDTIESEKRK